MNRIEALNILELDQSATEDDIKKKFRKLAARNHPDVNKSPDAEAKCKRITEAYEYLKNNDGKENINFGQTNIHFDNLNDLFRNFGGFNGGWPSNGPFRRADPSKAQQIKRPPKVGSASAVIDFAESVLGCKKNVEINRFKYCDDCLGAGSHFSGDLCSECKGAGSISGVSGNNSNVYIRMQCRSCNGFGKKSNRCNSCGGVGHKLEKAMADINIPPGVTNGDIVRLRGGGNDVSPNMRKEDAFVSVGVKPDAEIKMCDNKKDITSTIVVSLHDALKGVNKNVRTVLGDTEIKIRAGSRNRDEIKLEKYGVGKRGDHIFVLDVQYPENVENIIKALEAENE
jgi:molecular chaperone DnaJ